MDTTETNLMHSWYPKKWSGLNTDANLNLVKAKESPFLGPKYCSGVFITIYVKTRAICTIELKILILIQPLLNLIQLG